MRYRLNSRWLHGLKTDEEKQRRADLVLASAAMLDLLKEIAEQEIRTVAETTSDDYDSVAWSHKEADRHGQLRVWKTIRDLSTRTPV